MRRTVTESYSVDDLMLKTASSLLRDFQSSLNDPCYCSEFLSAIMDKNINKIRETTPAIDMRSDLDTYKFKVQYQMHSIFKRYRFEKDLYTDSELESLAIENFRNTQNRLASLDLDSLPAKTQRVLDLAREYIADTLGAYDGEEHRRLCRFGRRASVGVPARLACEAQRWEIPISGSLNQIAWFDSEMSQIDSIQEYLNRQRTARPEASIYQPIDSLRLTLVPKTFKSFRSIMPNTTIGSYMSFGLGEMIRKRLQRRGYNIATLQERHKFIARQASKGNSLTTADLSNASDSITRSLVERLFPADWFEILEQSRIEKVTLPDGSCAKSLTYCTMGIGYTFPLQTLVFLALLKAIQATLKYRRNSPRLISVYGDDMIYPSLLHTTVCRVFEQIGFVINLDKTFHEGQFRESCGGDYYRGVDVRPFQPRNGSATVGKRAYEATLYKLINGLLMRWDECEIRMTLIFLRSELEALVNRCKVVPVDFPDDSGIKCSRLGCWDFLPTSSAAQPKHIGHGLYRFSYLSLVADVRKETRHEPYLWLVLRDPPRFGLYHSDRDCNLRLDTSLQDLIRLKVGIKPTISLLKTKTDDPVSTFRSKISGRRLRRTSTYVTIGHTGRYMRQSGTSCFEDRR